MSNTTASATSGFGRRLVHRVREFARAEIASITVESVIILPIIVVALLSTFAYYEAYRRQSLALKANYAISDYLSRTHAVDMNTIRGMDDLFEYMTHTKEESWIRVTVVTCRRDNTRCNELTPRRLGRSWSRSTNGAQRQTRDTVRSHLAQYIPPMYNGEDLIVVETVAKFEPSLPSHWTGIRPTDLVDVIVTSPREYDTLCLKINEEDCPLPGGT